MESLDSWSDLPPDPPYGSNWGHKIENFDILPDNSLIISRIFDSSYVLSCGHDFKLAV